MQCFVLTACSAALMVILVPATAQTDSRPGEHKQRSAAADQSPFVGTWELDQSRTKLGSRIVTYKAVGNNIRLTNPFGEYEFQIDGKEYPTNVPGEMVSWKQIDKSTFESTVKRDGKIQSVSTRVVSSDGKTVSVTTRIIGETESTTKSTLERLSGEPAANPLLGTWRVRVDPTASGVTPTVTYSGAAEGLRVRYTGPIADEYTLVFDGKEHSGSTGTPSGTKLTAKKIDERTIQEKWTRDGKPFSTSTITVSQDGNELTERQQPGDPQGEPSIFVYRRASR